MGIFGAILVLVSMSILIGDTRVRDKRTNCLSCEAEEYSERRTVLPRT